MIALTTFLLFILGVFSSIRIGVKTDKWLSFVAFLAFGLIFAQFGESLLYHTQHTFSFIWNKSPGGDIKIDIISNPYNYGFILPFFVITFISLGLNLIFRYEERRCIYASGLIFNLAALITMVTSNNFVQLLFALFMVDIIALLLVHDIEAYRRYILLNMSADFMIFTILAVINSRVASLDIREILQYKLIGHHLNFITIIGLTAIFMKFGFFIFHIGLLGLQNIRLHRLQNILFLSAPVCGLILLMKFHVLLTGSEYFIPYLNGICLLSFGGGFIGSIISRNLKERVIYWQMMFWALLIILLCFNGFIWNTFLTFLLLQIFILNTALYLIYYYIGRRHHCADFSKINFSNKTALCAAFALIFLMIAGMTGILTDLYNKGNRYYIWTYAILFILSLSATLKPVFFVNKPLYSVHSPRLAMHYIVWLMLGGLSAIVLYPTRIFDSIIAYFCAAFVVLCVVTPLWRIASISFIYRFNQQDWIGKIYKYGFIKPLRLSGRVLWLLIDHLLTEKIVIGGSIALAQTGLRFFRMMHSNRRFGAIIIIILLLGFLGLAYQYE